MISIVIGIPTAIVIGVLLYLYISLHLEYGFITLAYGQMPTIEEEQKQNCENIQGTWINGKCTFDSNLIQLRQQLENSIQVLQAKQQGFEAMINYCFQHADRPNPLQDLVDKGFLPSNMTGMTCKDIKQMSDTNQNQISDLANKLNQVSEKMAKERDRMNTEFKECLRNQTMKDQECFLHAYNEENKTK